MGRTTISWCHYTFNLWWGCWKISPGCQNCYAAAFDRRVTGVKTDHWMRTGSRRFMSDDYWKQLRKWNEEARQAGERRRVFIGSMCDWAEKHPDPETNRQMDAYRGRMWEEIRYCLWLDFLLLTKRIENVPELLPWVLESSDERTVAPWHNVWIMTTVEDQEHADKRIPLLLKIPAAVRGLSIEPLLGPIELTKVNQDSVFALDALAGMYTYPIYTPAPGKIDWVIVGAESGHHARPCQADWMRSILEDCARTGTARFLKQAVLGIGYVGDAAIPARSTGTALVVARLDRAAFD